MLFSQQFHIYPPSRFIEKLDLAISRCLQNHSYLTLLLLDVDHFHRLTEAFGGQACGDIISKIGEMFTTVFPQDAIVGRMGEDELICAVLGVKPEKAFEMAEELFLRLKRDDVSLTANGETFNLLCTVSIGMATLPNDAIDRISLVDKARQALYRSKVSGGNCITIYEAKDSLTGLLNHYGITHRLDLACAGSALQNSPVSIISIDIDYLSQINDQHSRLAGDAVIKHFASLLQAKFGSTGDIGRYGGDQFIIVISDCQSESALILAEETRRQAENARVECAYEGTLFQVSYRISAGVATFPLDANERVDLLRKAGEALYRAKTDGRNRVSLPPSNQMVMKTNYYTKTQLARLSSLAGSLGKSEAFLLREALDDLLRKYNENPVQRP